MKTHGKCKCAKGVQCARCRLSEKSRESGAAEVKRSLRRAYTLGYADGQRSEREDRAKRAPFEREPPHCPTCDCCVTGE